MSFWPAVNPSVVPVVSAPPAGSALLQAAGVGPHGTPLHVYGLPAGTAAPPVVPAVSGVTPLPVAAPALPPNVGGPVPVPSGMGGPVPAPSMGGAVPVPSAGAPEALISHPTG